MRKNHFIATGKNESDIAFCPKCETVELEGKTYDAALCPKCGRNHKGELPEVEE